MACLVAWEAAKPTKKKEKKKNTLLTKLPSLVFILPTYFCALHVNLQWLCHSYSIFSHLDPIPLYGYHVFTTNSHPSSSLKSVGWRVSYTFMEIFCPLVVVILSLKMILCGFIKPYFLFPHLDREHFRYRAHHWLEQYLFYVFCFTVNVLSE